MVLEENTINDPELDAHVNAFKTKIGEMVLKRHRVYLDTNYWIYLREALTLGVNSVRLKIYNTLKRLVNNRIAICPISFYVFQELIKQSFDKRLATARIMDELSEQVCFVAPWQNIGQELLLLIRQDHFQQVSHKPFDPIKFVWTKVAHIVGENFPANPNFTEKEQLAMRIGFFDYLSTFSLEKILLTIGDNSPLIKSSNIIDRLNIGKDKNQNFKNFHALYMQEVKGALDTLIGDIRKLCLYLQKNGNENLQEAELFKMIHQKFDEDKIEKHLPYVRVRSGLHAYFRWDKTHRFHENDLIDFAHAACAMPYCNTFLTEEPLSHWVCNGLLKFDQLYGTKVIFKEEEALEYLQQLEKN